MCSCQPRCRAQRGGDGREAGRRRAARTSSRQGSTESRLARTGRGHRPPSVHATAPSTRLCPCSGNVLALDDLSTVRPAWVRDPSHRLPSRRLRSSRSFMSSLCSGVPGTHAQQPPGVLADVQDHPHRLRSYDLDDIDDHTTAKDVLPGPARSQHREHDRYNFDDSISPPSP